jgi:putative DNA primase/helicase
MIETDEQLDVELQHEQSLISCIMRAPNRSVPAMATTLPVEAFHRPAHRHLYEAVVMVAADGHVDDNGIVDLVAVADRLRDKGCLAECGGNQYIGEIALMQCSAANFGYYAGKVKEHWALRRAADAAAQIQAALAGGEPVLERLAEVRKLAAELSHVGNGELSASTKTFRDFELKVVDWLWHEVLPAAMFVMLVSEEGVGKSTLAAWIVAMVTKGGAWPNGGRVEPGRVIWLSTEESPEYVLAPRFVANGADLGRIIPGPDNFLTQDIGRLDAICAAHPDLRLIVMDPITSFVAGNENSNIDVRDALEPLVKLAERRGVCVLGLSHLNKKVDLKMINRTLGSRAWSAVPRMIWTVMRPADGLGDDNERLLLNIKNNLGPRPEGLKFRIESSLEYPSVGVVHFTGERTRQAADHQPEKGGRQGWLMADCEKWLIEYLTERGTVDSTQIIDDAENAGFKARMVYEAKKRAGVKARRSGFGGKGGWVWYI